MGASFLNRIKYKKELVGFVKKDGKTYTKYVKTRRFRISSNFKYAVLGVFVMVVLGLGIKFMIAELGSREAAPETAGGGGGG